MGQEILFSIVLMAITQIAKKWIQPKFGAVGIHTFILLLCLGFAGFSYLLHSLPVDALTTFSSIWLMAVGSYEVLIKRIGIDVLKVDKLLAKLNGKKPEEKPLDSSPPSQL